MKKSTTRVTLILVIAVIGIIAYYAYLSGRTRELKNESVMSLVENTLSRDLQKDYPPTVKETVKYYNEILKCFYNEKINDEEIVKLGEKARELYDAELLEHNAYETYMSRLKEDVSGYREKGRTITSASVAASTNVDYFEKNGFYFARIYCGYNIMENRTNKSVQEVYLLRRDENKRWKIYGWDLAENVNPGGVS